MRTTRAERSRCSSRTARARPAAIARLLLFAALLPRFAAADAQPPQEPPAQAPQEPVPSIEGAASVGPRIQAMVGKQVGLIKVERAGAPGEPVTPIDSGTSASLVRSLQTRVGEKFELRRIQADCTSLWNERRMVVSALAREVDGGVEVTFRIDAEIEVYEGVDFVGLGHLDQSTVDALLGLYPDRQTTHNEAEAMRKVLIARYRRDGYAFCNVELKPRPIADAGNSQPGLGRALRRLTMLVEEGAKVRVRDVTFHGNASFAADPILGYFGTGSYLVRDARIDSDPRRGILSGGAYSREVLDQDLDRLRLFYRSRGFLEATVDLGDVQFTEGRDEVDLSFVVVEGPRYRVRSVRVQHIGPDQKELAGDPLYPPAEVEQVLKVGPGEYYDSERLQRDLEAIEDFYGRRGHPSVKFPGMAQAQDGCRVFGPIEVYGDGPEVDVVFQVSEGSPKTLRDVVIRGNTYTKDEVIRRRFRVLPGERIDMLEVERAQARIEQTRYFQDPVSLRGPRLKIEPVPSDPDIVDLGLDLEEGPTGEFRWGIGYSTGIGAQGQLTFNKRNFDLLNPPSSLNPITAIGEILDAKAFHGGGQTLSMLLAPGTQQSQFQVSFLEPDLFGDHFDTWTLNVSGRRFIWRLPDGYTSDTLGGEIGIGRNFSEFFNANLSVRNENVRVGSLAQDATRLAYDNEGSTELRGAQLSLLYRDFDDLTRPTSGFDASLSFEVIGGPFGGDQNLTKWEHRANVYVPMLENDLGHRTVFHWRQFFGLAQEFGGSEDVFLTERFYMGGATLRGFNFRQAGPTQFTRPLGGEVIYTSSAELYFPLVATRLEGDARDREILRWLVFADAGLLGLGIDDPTFNQLRLSVGVGVRIEIPYLQIPIGIDVGWPVLYEETDDRRQLFLNFSR